MLFKILQVSLYLGPFISWLRYHLTICEQWGTFDPCYPCKSYWWWQLMICAGKPSDLAFLKNVSKHRPSFWHLSKDTGDSKKHMYLSQGHNLVIPKYIKLLLNLRPLNFDAGIINPHYIWCIWLEYCINEYKSAQLYTCNKQHVDLLSAMSRNLTLKVQELGRKLIASSVSSNDNACTKRGTLPAHSSTIDFLSFYSLPLCLETLKSRAREILENVYRIKNKRSFTFHWLYW